MGTMALHTIKQELAGFCIPFVRYFASIVHTYVQQLGLRSQRFHSHNNSC